MEYKDYTIKALLRHNVQVEQVLKGLGATYIGLDQQVDTYFKTPQGKLKLREGTIENVITHYERVLEDGAERTIVYRYESDPSAEAIAQLQEGHQRIGVIVKERKIYTLGNLKIHLDTLPDQQHFIEIEAIDLHNELSGSELKDQCLAMKEKLGIQEQDLMRTGYLPEEK